MRRPSGGVASSATAHQAAPSLRRAGTHSASHCSRTLAASVQFVRKLSGFTSPSRANEPAFDCAVDEVADVAQRLLDSLVTASAPRDREEVAARARERAAKRFARAG